MWIIENLIVYLLPCLVIGIGAGIILYVLTEIVSIAINEWRNLK